MATQSQIQANRLNAQKSTGPKTAEGKAVVAQNALKHGLFAHENVIKCEKQSDFDCFREELLDGLAPVGGSPGDDDRQDRDRFLAQGAAAVV